MNYCDMPPAWIMLGSIFSASLDRVIDGDTIRCTVELPLGYKLTGARVRLAGIQAPEQYPHTSLAGIASTTLLRGMLHHRRLILTGHPPGQDRFGRMLAWVWIIEADRLESVQWKMVDAGAAEWWWPPRDRLTGIRPPRQVKM